MKELDRASEGPTLESLEEMASTTRDNSEGLRNSLYSLWEDLCGPEASAGQVKQAVDRPAAIIERIRGIQNEGLNVLDECGKLVYEIRRALFSTPMAGKPDSVRVEKRTDYGITRTA